MSETPTLDPPVYDYVPAPEGYTCQMYRQPGHHVVGRCDNEAAILFVYEGNIETHKDEPENALACIECAPVPNDEVEYE